MDKFLSPSYGEITINELMIKIAERIKSKSEADWVIAVGTDSQNKGSITSFCSTIILLEKGKGGIYFYKCKTVKRIQEIRFRMLTEAEMSIELSKQVIGLLENMYLEEIFDFYKYNIELEIHCDLGNNGKSRDTITAALGWITAEFGGKVMPKIKPNSPAASYVADKYTK